MDAQSYRLTVFRHDPEEGGAPRYEEFVVEMPENLTVLQALLKIQDEQDGRLAFRYVCRGAVCGSCGMAVNGRLTLACRTSLSAFPDREITVEPLPNLEVVRDLLVNMDPFWRAYEKVQPWVHAVLPDKTQAVSEEDARRMDQYVNCILCACCWGACPVAGRFPSYLGPAALAKLERFASDPRDGRRLAGLAVADSEEGVWACDGVYRCIEHCPKDVRPYDGIGGLRRRIVAGRLLGKGRR